MTRGFAVLWMISIQLLDMFTDEFNLYVEHYDFVLKYTNWLPIFLIVSGFSLNLMLDRYGRKAFLKKNIIRGLKFIAIGILLALWCGWNLPTPFDEVVSSIGMSVLIFSILLYLIGFSTRRHYLASLFASMSCLVAFNTVFYVEGAFNPFWCLSFMIFGFILGRLRSRVYGFFSLSSCLMNFHVVDYFGRTLGFWVLNVALVSPFFALMVFLEKFGTVSGFLGYFGRHSLFFYVFHFAIFQKLLVVTNSYNMFPFSVSVFFVALSILALVSIERLWYYLRFSRISMHLLHVCE